MAPTTLITFLVRTPPSTRSVHLYGSWDNFTTGYPMQRDTRIGAEHWSGCHSFANIICDGDAAGASTPRQGGLKMGGTYWYFYRLDDEIEFHNSMEPSTTSCPMLPGQLTNVLNVPFALSSSGRPRNDSSSSTTSEYRTMKPTDKFVNPRPVPAKPSLPRLKTSPTFPPSPWSSTSSPISASTTGVRGRSASTRTPLQPHSATALRIVRSNPSSEGPSRSTSQHSNRSIGIIGAFKALASPLLVSPATQNERGRRLDEVVRSDGTSRGTSGRSVTPKRTATGPATPLSATETVTGASHELALRRSPKDPNEAAIPISLSSFAQHRRHRSLSREAPSLRSSYEVVQVHEANTSQAATTHQVLETVQEVASATNTPVWPLTAVKVKGEEKAEAAIQLDLEKRLPTLPNTPSSAYPPSDVNESPQHDPQSHFSCTTIDTASATDSYFFNDTSHFSGWTDAPANFSPQSERTSNATEFEPISPTPDLSFDLLIEEADRENKAVEPKEMLAGVASSTHHNMALPLALSSLTMSSVASSAASSSHPELESAVEGRFSWSTFQHYSLPSAETGSNITVKLPLKAEHPAASGQLSAPSMVQPHINAQEDPSIAHSTSMQQLLDELSYLGGMIQQH
jgi:hypothetical protein